MLSYGSGPFIVPILTTNPYGRSWVSQEGRKYVFYRPLQIWEKTKWHLLFRTCVFWDRCRFGRGCLTCFQGFEQNLACGGDGAGYPASQQTSQPCLGRGATQPASWPASQPASQPLTHQEPFFPPVGDHFTDCPLGRKTC